MSVDMWSCRRKVLRERLRERRHQLGLGQKQVASRLQHLGMPLSLKTVSTLELGAVLTVERLPVVAVALECSVPYLLGMTAEPHAWEPDPPTAERPRPRHLAAQPDLHDPSTATNGAPGVAQALAPEPVQVS